MRVHIRLALLAALYTTHSAAVSLGQDKPTEHRYLRTEAPDAADANNDENQEGVASGMVEERGPEWLQKLTAGLEYALGKMLGNKSLINKAAAKRLTIVQRQADTEANKEIQALYAAYKIQMDPVNKGEFPEFLSAVEEMYMTNVINVMRRRIMKTKGLVAFNPDERINGMTAKFVRESARNSRLDLNRLLEADVSVGSLGNALEIDLSALMKETLYRKKNTVKDDRMDPLTRTFLEYEWMKAEKDLIDAKMKKALVPTTKVHPLST
uniref:RxLR effector candidate protein n=2 Tax=Hyaloperonospora arabidopsidis (strain Emoy2) TaxID=559515 RepID=M4BVV4_HYAAE